MKPNGNRLWAFVCVLFVVHAALAHNVALDRRQDDSSPSQTPSPSPSSDQDNESVSGASATTTRDGTAESSPTQSEEDEEDDGEDEETEDESTTDDGETPSSTAEASEEPEESIFAAPIPEGELPIKPELTPGWGVAGVIMLCTGIVHSLIGIKNPWLHTFFSTAYLAALGTAVLIIYVMDPPISEAIQGAYVAAVALTGIILGLAGTFFKEVTEGLGCALGGFTFAMWLLCLRPGGLLPAGSTAAIVLIACFTVGVFALYFSRWTRDYALIIAISFSGATVTVLGIDSFSRAGLKEMWTYLWNLNENLFPLGADTYPLTRGIEVELAAIVLIFFAGIISQMKLWRIIKERRAKKAAEREEGQRNLHEEEENVGREIQAQNERERREWERVYGNGDVQSTVGSSDSGFVGDGDYEKKARSKGSHPGSTVQVQAIELNDMPSPQEASEPGRSKQEGLMSQPEDNDGIVTVRVAQDDTLPAPIEEDTRDPDEGGPDSQTQQTDKVPSQHQVRQSSRFSQDAAPTPPPAVVPLPFTVPAAEPNSRADDDERSSVATYADDGHHGDAPANNRHSFAHRLSQGSSKLLRRLSQRESRSLHPDEGHSQEDLVVPSAQRDGDDRSVAATMDLESLDEEGRSALASGRQSVEISADFAKQDEQQEIEPTRASLSSSRRHGEEVRGDKRISRTDTVASGIPRTPQIGVLETSQPDDGTRSRVSGNRASLATTTDVAPEGVMGEASREPSAKAKSVLSAESVSASLTRERLPQALSKVAMSYRTNEWAKHLSHAEIPEPEALQLGQPVVEEQVEQITQPHEAAVPLDIASLQQTAETGAPAPRAAPTSGNTAGPTLSRSNSKQSTHSIATQDAAAQSTATTAAGQSHQPQHSGPVKRQSSMGGLRRTSTNLHIQPIHEESAEQTTVEDPRRNSSGVASPVPSERGPTPGVVSYSSPQTLLGQREMYLRNKSNPGLAAAMTMPDLAGAAAAGGNSSRPASEAGSLYNYPVYNSSQPLPTFPDHDDIPLRQRKELMRQSSSGSGMLRNSMSFSSRNGMTGAAPAAEGVAFDSHQPQRHSSVPSAAARQSQLAAFRQSVQMDLRSGTPVGGQQQQQQQQNGRDSTASFYASTPYGSGSLVNLNGAHEVQRNIDMQRSMLMGQKEAEARRKEAERLEKERGERAFAARMQSGDFLETHRDVMRKMQSSANIKDS